MAHLKRIIVESTTNDDLDTNESYWLCEDCLDAGNVEGDIIDQGESFQECYVCGVES